jgi:succinate-acetate transporter protein
LGAFFVYWAEAKGYQALILKEHQEPIAISLMGVATVLFLMRALCYRMEIDFILAVMSVNFLRREIHFVGTDNGVVIVAGLVLIWILIRKNQIWASSEQQVFSISHSPRRRIYEPEARSG